MRIQDYFKKTGRTMTDNNVKQALIPEGGIVLRNDRGTAPGCIIEGNNKIFIILPGPPIELNYMFEHQVKPYLHRISKDIIFSRVLRIFGIGESTVEDILKDLIQDQNNPTIAPYAGYGEVTIRLTAKCHKEENPLDFIEPVEKEIRKRLQNAIYGIDDDTLESVVGNLLIEKGFSVSLAESCTGGMIASKLTNVPGISQSFIEGAVVYSNDAKIRRLGVSPCTLDRYGAVSAETAKEMAEGIRLASGTDISLSVTGIAGPGGGTSTKPVGLVYIGVAMKGKDTVVHKLQLAGSRERIRSMSCLHGLNYLRLALLNVE